MDKPADRHRILVVEDDSKTCEAIKLTLQLEGYEVSVASDGLKGLKAIEEKDFEVVVLDRAMPKMDGLALCERIRAKGNRTPVLFLSAYGEVESKLEGFTVGGDDYLSKPFSADELLARIKALMRRSAGAESGEVMVFADLEVDPKKRTAKRDGEELVLTKFEFDLLEVFILNKNIVMDRYDLYEKVWGDILLERNRTLETHIKNLRRKMEEGSRSRIIHTVRGVGYVLKLAQ